MKIYSIVRIGSEYVLQVGDNSVLKVATRRTALRVISDAAELLATQLAPQPPGQEPVAPSIAPDPGITPDPGTTPDAGIRPDSLGDMPEAAGNMAERSEVP